MDKIKNIKFWYLILVAFMIFPIKLAGNFRYFTYIYIYVVPLIYMTVNYKYIINLYFDQKSNKFKIFNIIYIYLFMVSVITPIIRHTFDFSYITSYWKGIFLWIIKYLFLVVIFRKYVYKKELFEEFTNYFIGAVSLYSLVSMLSSLFKPLRYLMVRIIYLSNDDVINLQRGEYYTRFGWTGWSGYNETFICTLAVVLACIMILKSNEFRKQSRYLIAMVLPIIGNAMFGRIGLLVSIICVVITSLCVIFQGNVKYIIMVTSMSIIAIILFIILKQKMEILQNWYKWVFSAFEAYRKTGKFYDNMGTIEHLTTDMYWMPKPITFWLGDGRYTNADGGYYLHTDSGIMRPILYYGFLNYMFSLVGVILSVLEFTKKIMIENSKSSIITVIFIICIAIGLFEFKGESLWMFIGVMIPLVCLMNLSVDGGKGNLSD